MGLRIRLNPPTPLGSSGVLELCLVFPLPNPPPGADQTEKNYVDPPPGGESGGGPGGDRGRAHWADPNRVLLVQDAIKIS